MAQRIQMGIDVTADVSKAKTAFQELQASLQRVSMNAITPGQNLSQLGVLKEADKAAQNLQLHMSRAFNVNTGQLQLDKFNQSMAKTGDTVQSLSAGLINGGQAGQQAFMNMARQITYAQVPTQALGNMFNSLWTTMKSAAKWQFAYGAINAFTSSIRDAVSYTKELDTSLNKIRIVTGMTKDEMDSVARSANKMAKELSASTKDIVKGQLIYFQQGDSAELAAKKAEITTKASNIAFSASQEQMAEYLTAIWNSYKVGENQLESFADKIAAVGANTATSMEELATAMQKVASTAQAVGVTYDQLNATIATISSTTRLSADTVGTALKTVYARIADLKLGGEDESGVTLGKVSEQLQTIGINILDDTGELRDMGIVVEEIGEKWQGMTKAQKDATAQAIAGKRTYTQVMALFENFDKYKENLQISMGAEGELDKQQKIFSESWEAASKRLRATFEGLYDDLLNEDVFIKFTDGLTILTKLLGEVVKGAGGIPGILSLVFYYLLQIRGVRIEESLQNTWRMFQLAFGGGAREAEKTKTALMELANGPEYQMLSEQNQRYFDSLVRTNEYQIAYTEAAKNMSDADRTEIETKRLLIETLEQEAAALKETQTQQLQSLSRANGYNGRRLSTDELEGIRYSVNQQTQKSQAYTALRRAGVEAGNAPLLTQLGSNKSHFGQKFSTFGPGYQQTINKIIDGYNQLDAAQQKTSASANVFKEVQTGLSSVVERGGNSANEAEEALNLLTKQMEEGVVNSNTFSNALQILYNAYNGVDEATAQAIAQEAVLAQARRLGATGTDQEVMATDEYQQAVANLTPQIRQLINTERDLANTDGMVKQKHQEVIRQINEKVDNSPFISVLSGLASAAMSISMLTSGLGSLIDDFQKGTVTVQSFVGVLMALSMLIPMITKSIIAAIHSTGAAAWGNWITAIIQIIGILIGVLMTLKEKFHWFESAGDKLKRVGEEFKEIKQEVEGLNNELKTTQDRIDELQSKDKLSLTEEEELARLKQENAELQEKLELLNKEAEIKGKEVRETAEDYISNIEEKIQKASPYLNEDRYEQYYNPNRTKLSTSNAIYYEKSVDEGQNIVNKIKAARQAKQYIKEHKEDILHPDTDLKRIDKDIEKQQKELIKKYKDVEEHRDQLGYSEEDQKIKSRYNAYLKSLEIGIYSPGEINAKNAQQLQGVLEGLKIDPTTLTGVDKFTEKTKEQLKELGFTDEEIAGQTDTLTKALNLLKKSLKEDADATKKTAKTGDELVESMTKSFQAMDKVKGAADSMAKSGKVGLSAINGLSKAFKEADVDMSKYEHLLYQNSRNAEGFNQVLSQMVGELVQQTFATNGATEETRDYVQQMLEEYGVTNAAAVAQAEYTKALVAQAVETQYAKVEGASFKEVLDSIAQQYGITTEAALKYYLQEKIINNSNLSLQQKITEIGKLAEKYQELYGSALLANTAMKMGFAGVVEGKPQWYYTDSSGTTTYYDSQADMEAATQADLNNISNKFNVNTGVHIQGTGKSGGKGGGKSPAEQDKAAIADLKEQFEWDLITWDAYQQGVEEIIKRGNLGIKDQLSARKDIFDEGQKELDVLFEAGKISAMEYSQTIEDYMTKTQLQPKQRIEAYKKVWEAFDKEAERNVTLLEREISHREAWRIRDLNQDIYDLGKERKIYKERYIEYVKQGETQLAEDYYEKMVEVDKKILDKRKEQYEEYIKSIENKMEDSAILGWEPGTSKIGYLKKLLDEAYGKQDWDTPEQQEETIRQRRNALLQEARTEMQWFYDEWKDEQNQITERIKAQKSIWSGYYETSNNLLEAQHDINKELQKSLTSMQYLDEDTRKLLFNTEDYAALTKEINKLQTQATKLRKDYLDKVEGKTKEEVSLLTEEYERQNKLLQKQYEIAKKQLEVDKARMELNNILNERNTRMFIGGQWQWVANSEAVIEAQEKLADAEYESQKVIMERDQQMYLNQFDESVADITKVLNDMEAEWKRIDEELAGHAQNMLDVFTQLPQQVQELMGKIYDVVGLEGGYSTIPSKTLAPANHVDESIPYGYGKNTLSTLGKTVEIAGTATLDTSKLVNSQVNANYRFSQQQIAERTLKTMGSSSTTDNRITINGFTINGDTSDGEALRSVLTRVIGNR